MADTHETIADIVAWLRRPIEGENAYLTLWRDEIAARIEVALRRERGDCAKLREALEPFPSLCDWLVVNAPKLGIPDMVAKLRERGDKARAALAATEKEGGAK